MTDNTQELDEAEMGDSLDEILEDFYDGDIRQSDMGKAKLAILDWHNKQTEAELEALREEVKHEDLRTISQVITARIDKLKEAEL